MGAGQLGLQPKEVSHITRRFKTVVRRHSLLGGTQNYLVPVAYLGRIEAKPFPP